MFSKGRWASGFLRNGFVNVLSDPNRKLTASLPNVNPGAAGIEKATDSSPTQGGMKKFRNSGAFVITNFVAVRFQSFRHFGRKTMSQVRQSDPFEFPRRGGGGNAKERRSGAKGAGNHLVPDHKANI